jgi:hypothetical protein
MNKVLNYKKWASHKKKLRRRRRQAKKGLVVYRIIPDTNVLYKLGSDDRLFNHVKNNLYPTYVNLWELTNTGSLVSKFSVVRCAIQKMLLCKDSLLLVEPLKYLIEFSNKNCTLGRREYAKQLLLVARKISDGATIKEELQSEFELYLNEAKEEMKNVEIKINEMAVECKKKIKNNQRHRKILSLPIVYQLVDSWAVTATCGQLKLKKSILSTNELFFKVLDNYFKCLEVGEYKWKRNDLFDLFNMAYVRKGDKYWTHEKKWLTLIKKAGCEQYLYMD